MQNMVLLTKFKHNTSLSLDNCFLEFWDSKPGWYLFTLHVLYQWVIPTAGRLILYLTTIITQLFWDLSLWICLNLSFLFWMSNQFQITSFFFSSTIFGHHCENIKSPFTLTLYLSQKVDKNILSPKTMWEIL